MFLMRLMFFVSIAYDRHWANNKLLYILLLQIEQYLMLKQLLVHSKIKLSGRCYKPARIVKSNKHKPQLIILLKLGIHSLLLSSWDSITI